MSSHASLMGQIAATDATFALKDGLWVGRCLICRGPVAFDAATGEGTTIEHILPRTQGGTNDLNNLGIVHGRCNNEKGRRWDARRRHSARQDQYDALLQQIADERMRRWRPQTLARELAQ